MGECTLMEIPDSRFAASGMTYVGHRVRHVRNFHNPIRRAYSPKAIRRTQRFPVGRAHPTK